jgi:hypothetical protein
MESRYLEDNAMMESPGGFIFGVQGWDWGVQQPKSITFFLDGTAGVYDQHGRPIRGAIRDGKEVLFAKSTHVEILATLEAERIDWKNLSMAGWPQIPYDELIELSQLPPTPIEELRKIKDRKLRKDAIRARREADEKVETLEAEDAD